MPTFITYASYSHSGLKGLVDKPSDRTDVIKGLVAKLRFARIDGRPDAANPAEPRLLV